MKFSVISASLPNEQSVTEHLNYSILQAIFSLSSNLLLLAILAGVPKLRRPINYLVGNLCLSCVIYTSTCVVRLAEWKRVLVLRDHKCLIWNICQRMGPWITASTLSSISLHECYKYKLQNSFESEPKISATVKIMWSWFAATFVSSLSVYSSAYNASVSNHTLCNDALYVRHPMMHLWQNLMAFNVFYLWGTFHLIYELFQIRQSVIDFVGCRYESENHGRCEDEFLLQKRVKQLKYILCYSFLYLMIWTPQGINSFLWSLLHVDKKNISELEALFIRVKIFFDEILHPVVTLLPLIFISLSCTLTDLKLCFQNCLCIYISPIPPEHRGVYNNHDEATAIELPTVSNPNGHTVVLNVATTAELSNNSQLSLESQSQL